MPTISNNHSTPCYQPGVALEDLQLILEKTSADVWNALRKQRIFITGGTGFVGCWLLEALIWANQQLELELLITVLSRDPHAFTAKAPHLAKHPIVNVIQGSVNELKDIHSIFDIVIHAATDVAKTHADALLIFNDIIQGTEETLALAQRCKAQRYLLTSSGAVYGRQPCSLLRIPESYLGAPDTLDVNTAYGQGKRISEWIAHCHAQKHGLNVSIARCFALIGPYLPMDAHFAAGNFIRDGLNNNKICVSGDGKAYRSYLYAADMVIWLLTILMKGAPSQSYNLGSDEAISIKELAESISMKIYAENKVAITTQALENARVQKYVPDISKAKNELNLFPYTSLHAAIEKTIAWEIRNREQAANKLGF